MAARGHAADEDALVSGVRLHAHAIAENGAAAERAGRIDRDDADGSRRSDRRNQAIDQRALAGAGRSGDADVLRAAGIGVELTNEVCAGGRLVLNERNRAGERPRVSRLTRLASEAEGAAGAGTVVTGRAAGGR